MYIYVYIVFFTAAPTSRRRRDSRAETPARLISRSRHRRRPGKSCPGATL